MTSSKPKLTQKQKRLRAFARLKQLRQEIMEETGGNLPDSVEVLRKLREERDRDLMGE